MKETIKPDYPMRINKYLALKGYSTRRGADELIEAKKVTINGKLAVLGSKVNEADTVEVKGKSKQKPYKYLAFKIIRCWNDGSHFSTPSIHNRLLTFTTLIIII